MSSYIQATPRGGALHHGPLFVMPPELKEVGEYIDMPKRLCWSVSNKKFVSRLQVTLKIFVLFYRLETQCRIYYSGYFHTSKINIYGVMGLDFVKIRYFWQIASGGICVQWKHLLHLCILNFGVCLFKINVSYYHVTNLLCRHHRYLKKVKVYYHFLGFPDW